MVPPLESPGTQREANPCPAASSPGPPGKAVGGSDSGVDPRCPWAERVPPSRGRLRTAHGAAPPPRPLPSPVGGGGAGAEPGARSGQRGRTGAAERSFPRPRGQGPVPGESSGDEASP